MLGSSLLPALHYTPAGAENGILVTTGPQAAQYAHSASEACRATCLLNVPPDSY